MSKVKVRHALASYTVELPNGTKTTEHAFRGEVIDVPDAGELARLREHGAVVDPDTELEYPGLLMDLAESASDEEMLNWVRAASPTEIRKLVNQRPAWADRVSGHLMRVEEERRRSNELLGLTHNTLIDHLADAEVPEFDSEGRPTKADAGMTAGVQTGVGGSASIPHDAVSVEDAEGGGEGGEGGEATEDDTSADAIVQRNAREISEWISNNPRRAPEILEAENRLVASGANNGQPRKTVVAAVEAAAGFTQ